MPVSVLSVIQTPNLLLLTHISVDLPLLRLLRSTNLKELEEELLSQNMHFAELSSGSTNQTELIALLIIQGKNFVEGIENVYNHIKGSCSMLLLTEDGVIAATR